MINSVRNTVLSVLNKNNYGYISPSDFNLYAKQAQLEIFEDRYRDYNKIINAENARLSGTDYADAKRTAEEAMEQFAVTDALYPLRTYSPTAPPPGVSRYSLPTQAYNGNDYYMITNINLSTEIFPQNGFTTSGGVAVLDDSGANFFTLPSIAAIAVNTTTNAWAYVTGIVSATQLSLSNNIFTAGGQGYEIRQLSDYRVADKTTMTKVTMHNNSMFLPMSARYPMYVQTGDYIDIYPQVDYGALGSVMCTYFRYPKDPKWTYISLPGGEPSFNQSALDYQDFELPIEDEYRLVAKILQYCGVSIREAEVYQFAKNEEVQDKVA